MRIYNSTNFSFDKMNSTICVVIVFLYVTLLVNCSIQLPEHWNCEDKPTLHWLWNLRNNDRCATIIIESIFVPKCVFQQMTNSKFVLKTYDLDTLQSRNILAIPPTNCDNFFLFVRNTDDIVELLKPTHIRRFVPFSQLFILTAETGSIEFDATMLNYIYESGIFVFLVENTYSSSNTFRYLSLQNVLTGETLNITNSNRNDSIRYFGSYKKHSFFDLAYKKKIFRVSLFKCAPYIIYLPDGTLDGIQYRMLQEIAKSWKMEHRKCDLSRNMGLPLMEVLKNVDEDISDLAMCSIWMDHVGPKHDMSSYFDLQCGTFLVPKPKELNPAAYLYLSLNSNDWCGFGVSLIIMTMCFTMFTKIGRRLNDSWKDYVYNDLTRSSIDALNIVTNHGLAKFPVENTMRLLVNSWLIVSFIIGVGYSTGFTSFLNKPVFSDSIDTLEQLVESNLTVLVNYKNFAQGLIASGSEINIQLAKHVIFDNDKDKNIRDKRIDKQAVFVKVVLGKYIGEVDSWTDPKYRLRLMKSCIFNHYTIVMLKKYSLYTQHVNERIRWLKESGIISHWMLSLEGINTTYSRPYFGFSDTPKHEPKRLSIENLSGAFMLLFVGLGVALMTHISERIYFYLKKCST